jgi:hypothetical protein
MRRFMFSFALALLVLAFGASSALAQSGHFVGAQTCRDLGTTLQCSGKVAGLGGTTFEIRVTADGTASVQCRNPAGNVAPGQSFDFDAAGSTGSLPTPRNGQFRYTVATTAPTAPAGSCPNPMWTATVTDVSFTNITLELYEGGVLVDTAEVS